MGLARELSQGPRRRRNPAREAAGLDMAALRRLTLAERPDLDTFGKILERTARAAGDPVWDAAAARYAALVPGPV